MTHRMDALEVEILLTELSLGAVNPAMEAVQVGDVYLDGQTYANGAFSYVYLVRAVEPMSTRFGKPNRIVTVDVYTTNNTYIERTKRWVTTFK